MSDDRRAIGEAAMMVLKSARRVPAESDRMHQELARRASKVLEHSFQQPVDANFLDLVSGVLAGYPVEIIMKVTDPCFGLARRYDRFPTIKQIVEACAQLVGEREIKEKRQRAIKKQLAEREENERRAREAPTQAELEANFDRPIQRRGQYPAPSVEEVLRRMSAAIEHVVAKYGDP